MGTLDTLDVLYTINSALALAIFVLRCRITLNRLPVAVLRLGA